VIEFQLSLTDLGRTWHWSGSRWASERSWVEPLENPALLATHEEYARSGRFVIRERVTRVAHGRPSTSAATASPNMEDWPLDWFLVGKSEAGYRLAAGIFGTAPVYVAAKNGILFGSWDLASLVRRLGRWNLNYPASCQYLSGRRLYSRETLFESVFRITERASVTFSQSGLSFEYPEGAAHTLPRDLRSGADVVGTFESILRSTVSRRLIEPGSWVTELSGGLDSANVADVVAQVIDEPLTTYGLQIEGMAGAQQARRRNEMVTSGGFDDVFLKAADWLPFCAHGARSMGHPFAPEEEPYSEALNACLDKVGKRNKRVVFTGIGGDELMAGAAVANQPYGSSEKAHTPDFMTAAARNAALALCDPAPASIVTEPSLEAAACRAPVFLRRGFWPVSPLCTPELIRYCEWLPAEWRNGKRLLRSLLARRGFSHDVLYPARRENFSSLMKRSLQLHAQRLYPSLRQDSFLLDHGIVDPQSVHELLTCAIQGRLSDSSASDLYRLISLELSLRSLS
jgi:Asparagine synthase